MSVPGTGIFAPGTTMFNSRSGNFTSKNRDVSPSSNRNPEESFLKGKHERNNMPLKTNFWNKEDSIPSSVWIRRTPPNCEQSLENTDKSGDGFLFRPFLFSSSKLRKVSERDPNPSLFGFSLTQHKQTCSENQVNSCRPCLLPALDEDVALKSRSGFPV